MEILGGNAIPLKSSKNRSKETTRNCWNIHLVQKDKKFLYEDVKNVLLEWCKTNCKYWIFSYELGEKEETPHIQGYFEYKKKKRITEDKILKQYNPHYKICKGDKAANTLYCIKEGRDINCSDPRYIELIKEDKELNVLTKEQLYEWQKNIINIIEQKPDDRTINWIFEGQGNKGKSALCKYICFNHNAICVGGKATDIKYGILKFKEEFDYYPRIVIIDLPRSYDNNFLNYHAIEEIKNGLFFSTKYECKQVIMNSPHILIFSNKKPETEKLSEDRWNIINIEEKNENNDETDDEN